MFNLSKSEASVAKPLTIVADANIASLADFFNEAMLKRTSAQAINIVTVAGRDIDAQLLAKLQPEILLIRSVTPINEALLADNTSVMFIGSATIGTDHVDQAYLRARDISFANAAGSSKHSVAQYVITAILTLRPHYAQQPMTMTLGIIGLGNIGSTLAQYAADLGWQVLGYDPLQPQSAMNNASFEQVLSRSDVLSLHVPLTYEQEQDEVNGSAYPTYHLIDSDALQLMPASSLLINSARGAVISAEDLETDIKTTSRQVVLDVFEHEPQISESLLSRLAIATPHIAGYTLEGKLRGTQMIYDALCARLAITPVQTMLHLLPDNMFLWAELLAHPDRVTTFYDIMQDDARLRSQVNKGQVNATDFDKLRREYHLRREWQA